MRNLSKNEFLSKNNTNTKNSLNLENTIISSNILTANHFYQAKDTNEKNKSKEKNDNELKIKENKVIGNTHKNNAYEEKVVIHNQFLNDNKIKPKLKKANSELEIFQDYLLEDYKNQKINDQRNIIEKLGACVEKKFNSIRYWKNNNQNNNEIKGALSVRMKGINPIYEYDKNSVIILPKKGKHSYSQSHILDMKNKDSFPLLMNSPLNYEKKFVSCSQRERNEKNLAALFKLKHYLSLYWKQRKEIISEFFQKNNIYQEIFYEEKNLYNFANFINDNVVDDKKGIKCTIETRIPMPEIILRGIKYKPGFNLAKKGSGKIKINNLTLRKNRRISETVDGDAINREKDMVDYIEGKDKLNKYRSYLERNYKKYIINKMLKRFTKEEKKVYFSRKKYGQVEIIDKKNLANNIQKQALYQKIYDNINKDTQSKNSINLFNNDDLRKLNQELNVAKESVFSKSIRENKLNEQVKEYGRKKLKLKNNIINQLNQRLYYTTKEKFHQNNPEVIPKKKQKLLEYVIAKRIKLRKDFEDKCKKDDF